MSRREEREEIGARLRLRPVDRERDLPVFFLHHRDPEANAMAAFTAPDPSDHDAFLAHWNRILEDPTVVIRTIEVDDEIAGHVLRYEQEGVPEVSYWIGREYWGRGVATVALRRFLDAVEVQRPLRARVAADNVASARVLRKCGFQTIVRTSGYANARGEVVEEWVMELSEAP